VAKLKKTSVRVNVKGNEVIQTFDGQELKAQYGAWKAGIDKSGSLGVVGGASLLSILEKHGKVGRGGEGAPLDDSGSGEILDVLNKILDSNALIEESDKEALNSLKTDLTYIEKNNNPRNIEFTVPIENSYNKKVKEWKWQKVYGHYRTPGYVQRRKQDGSENELSGVSDSWWNTAKDASEPPMWKALFGTGGLSSFVVKAIDVMKTMEVSVPTLTVRNRGTVEKIMELDDVMEYVREDLIDKDEFSLDGGAYNVNKARNLLMSKPFTADNNKESNLVKDAANIEEVVGKVAAYKIDITPLMMKRLAIEAGFKDIKKSWWGYIRGN